MTAVKDRNNMTQGIIWKQLLGFFFPLLLGVLFQQLYNTADTMIVGRFVGTAALAAVGVTTPILNLALGTLTGLSSGVAAVIAQFYGAGWRDDVNRGVHTTLILAGIVGVIFAVAGFLLAPQALIWIKAPADTYADALTYLRIYFIGVIPMSFYNLGTAIMRAIGDSRRPFLFLVISSVLNIVLDALFIIVFHWGVAGAAVATVIAQVVSVLFVLRYLRRAEGECYQLFVSRLKVERKILIRILKIGVPAAIQILMYTLSNLLIQASVNSFSTETVAAWSAYGKLDFIFWMSISTMATTLTTFVGQNVGAGNPKRVKRGIVDAYIISFLFSLALLLVSRLFPSQIIGIFTADEAVKQIGMQMLLFMAPSYLVYHTVELLPGAMRGAGKTLEPTVIALIFICGLRVVYLLTYFPTHQTLKTVLACYPISWTLAGIALLIYSAFGHWLTPKTEKNKSE